MTSKSLLVVAGEASGDLHGGRLLTQLRELVPDLEVFGLGGDEMADAGIEAVAHSREIAVIGIWEALRMVPRARRIMQSLIVEVERRRPAAAVLIDAPDFNLRLAKKLRRRGVPVVYYVSPQVWAWRRGRVKTIRARVQRMLVLFGFEEEFYRPFGVSVAHVGHPLVDEVPQLPHVLDGVEAKPPFRIALLPGSRDSEVRKLLPLMLDAAGRLGPDVECRVALIEARTVSPELIEEILGASSVPVERMRSDRFEAVAASHLALCASGTATLEVGLIGTPMIVLYRVAALTAVLARLLIRVSHVSLVNLVMDGEVVPEMLQGDAEPEKVAAKIRAMLRDPRELTVMRAALSGLRGRLGESGASRRAAAEVARVLEASA